MKDLKLIIENLTKIYFVAKMLHWNATDNYSDHLLYDRIAEDCIDFTDKIAESCIFPFDVINRLDLEIKSFDITSLKEYIVETANTIEKLCNSKDISEGAKNTLSGIAEALNIKAYLLKDK